MMKDKHYQKQNNPDTSFIIPLLYIYQVGNILCVKIHFEKAVFVDVRHTS